MKIINVIVLAAQLAYLLLFTPCAEQTAPGGQSLEQAANDPTASLMSVQIQDQYSGAYYKLENESGNTMIMDVAEKTANASKEGGFLGFGGVRVSNAGQSFLNEKAALQLG